MRCLGIHRERPRDQKTRQASANQLPEILLVQVLARLQDTQEATASLAHAADLWLLPKTGRQRPDDHA